MGTHSTLFFVSASSEVFSLSRFFLSYSRRRIPRGKWRKHVRSRRTSHEQPSKHARQKSTDRLSAHPPTSQQRDSASAPKGRQQSASSEQRREKDKKKQVNKKKGSAKPPNEQGTKKGTKLQGYIVRRRAIQNGRSLVAAVVVWQHRKGDSLDTGRELKISDWSARLCAQQRRWRRRRSSRAEMSERLYLLLFLLLLLDRVIAVERSLLLLLVLQKNTHHTGRVHTRDNYIIRQAIRARGASGHKRVQEIALPSTNHTTARFDTLLR